MSDGADAPCEAPAPHRRDKRATLANLASLAREYGPGYLALELVQRAAAWVPATLDERLLAIEARHESLGPAHRRWSQHSVTRNREVWSGWAWEGGGEEWTASEDWKASLVEHVLEPAIPIGGTVVEIGPGAGRWTQILHERADRLILVDITPTTLELCRVRLGDPPDVDYLRSGGSDLAAIATDSVDSVWAYDTFVHIAPLDIQSYLQDIHRVLHADGSATIHHADRRVGTGWRAPMSAALFAKLARDSGLTVVRQFDAWDGGRYGVGRQGDVITQLRRDA